MKRWLLLALVCLFAPLCYGQTLQNPLQGPIQAASASCVQGAATCVWMKLAPNQGTVAVTITGTFSATLVVEESSDSGITFTTLSTLTAITTATQFSAAGMTDFRVRASAYTSGSALVFLQSSTASGSSSGAVGSATSPASPIMGFYFTSACPASNTGQCFNTFADTQMVSTCGWTSGTPSTVTCTGSPFVVGDIGKQVAGWNNCDAFQTPANSTLNAITASGAPTITGFTSANVVTISSATNAQTGTASCFVFGHPDDTAAAALEAVYGVVTGYCPKVFLGAAMYMFTKPHFFTQPPGCLATPFLADHAALGNTYYAGGFELEGRGVGVTQIFLSPNFPNGDTCARGSDADYPSCFVAPVMSRWRDFSITGGSNLTASIGNGHSLINTTVASIDDISCTNFGGFTPGFAQVGLSVGQQTQLYQFNNSGCGSIGVNIARAQQGNIVAIKMAIENSLSIDLVVQLPSNPTDSTFTFTCITCQFYSSQGQSGTPPTADILNKGGSVYLQNTRINTGFSASNNAPNITGYLTGTNAGSRLVAKDSNFDFASLNTTNTAINQPLSGTVVLEDTFLNAQSSGFTYKDVAGSTLTLLGANTLNPQLFSVAGTIIADGQSLTGICTGVGTAASTLALRISGTSTTGTGIPTTCTSTTLDAGTPMTQARTVSTMQVTATAAGTNASSGVVTVLKNGVATTITCTIGTGTSCNDFTHTVAFVKGDLLSMQFTTQAADTLAGVKAQVIWQ